MVNSLQIIADLPEIVTLPDHLIVNQILTRLPVKTLTRFKSVSKFWFSTISAPKFAKLHLNFSSSSSNPFLLLTFPSFKLLLLPYDDKLNKFKEPFIMDFTLVSFLQRYEQEVGFVLYSGCANGLICSCYSLNDQQYFFFAICNPALHQCCEITNPESLSCWPIGHWFGYVPSVDDYIIVAPFLTNNDLSSMHFYVFSLRSGKWKRIYDLDSVAFEFERLNPKTLVIDDILYWSLHSMRCDPSERGTKRIVGFDLVNEQLIELSWMDWLNKYEDAIFFMINGCLSLHCCCMGASDVWTLKQHDDWSSWEKLSSIHLGDMSPYIVNPTAKLLLRDSDHLKFIDLSKNTEEQPEVDAYFCGELVIGGVGDYVESLISPFGTIKSIEEEDHED